MLIGLKPGAPNDLRAPNLLYCIIKVAGPGPRWDCSQGPRAILIRPCLHDIVIMEIHPYLILSYLFTDAPSIQKSIASYAYLWFVISPAFVLEI